MTSSSAAAASSSEVQPFAAPTGPVVSVFDFDGTLFRSPAPSNELQKRYPGVSQPYESKGLGWFHNRRSLHPPYVPDAVQTIDSSAFFGSSRQATAAAAASDKPDANTYQQRYFSYAQLHRQALPHHPEGFDKWFIAPTVAAYLHAKDGGHVTAILTGRETSFTERLTALVTCAGLSFDHVYLKHQPGTIKFKIDVFIELIKKYEPRMLIYYEDRPDQGTKIHQGFLAALPRALGPEKAAYYSSPETFAIVLIPKEVSEASLPAALEAQLFDELQADALAAGQGRANASSKKGGGAPSNSEKGSRKK
eukprot:GILI01020662.1.p1 GENE.GILI01020662.1~~GILI01020662.1.p1  ORF type:complete len:307 (-),score=59.12 GILI01020662.1:32-952(-)